MIKSDLFNLCFYGGGNFTSKREWIHQERTINSNELIVVTKGEIFIEENGKRFTVKENEFLILHKNLPHKGTRVSKNCVCFYWLHFNSDIIPGDLSYGKLYNPALLIEQIERLLHISSTPGYLKKTSECILYSIFSELIFQTNTYSQNYSLAAKVHEYIHSNSNSKITTESISSHFGYNPDHLSRIMKKNYGRTLKEDVSFERINAAKTLLRTTNYTITEIAEILGYTDVNLFQKFFRYHTGYTPTEFRNNIIN